MDRVTRAQAELCERKAFAEGVRRAGPPCLTCRHKTLLGRCSNPAYAKQFFDPTMGRYLEMFETEVDAARAEDGLCGPEAILWEDMSLPQAYWREAQSFVEKRPWWTLFAVVGLWWAISLLF